MYQIGITGVTYPSVVYIGQVQTKVEKNNKEMGLELFMKERRSTERRCILQTLTVAYFRGRLFYKACTV